MHTSLGANAAQLDVSSGLEPGTRLSLSVHYPTGSGLAFCRYHTPFEGIRSDFLTLTDPGGKPVDYRGIMPSRVPPAQGDFNRLDAGETRRVSFDISDAYVLKPGNYQVRFRGGVHNGLRDSNTITLSIARQ